MLKYRSTYVVQHYLERIKTNLDSYKNAFNFVGLHEGFDVLHQKKKKEETRTLTCAFLLATLIIVAIIIEIYLIYAGSRLKDIEKELFYIMAVPSLSLLAILIYFFRILISNHNQLKNQIIQIELRKTLCRFIHNYSDYAKEMKEKDNESLRKFEDIIFSEITQHQGETLSLFDGIEKIINATKSSS